MPKITWDDAGERFYETGVKNGVLYTGTKLTGKDTRYGKGVPWNGLTAVNESPSGAEANPIYADNIKYLNLMSNEEFGCTIEAYTYPDEFADCDGSRMLTSGLIINQQTRKRFGFCYRTEIGNDEDGIDHGFKLHLIYECLASPSEKSYATMNDSPEAITFSWEVSTTPIAISGYKDVAHLIIDSRKADSTKLATLMDMLYGTDGSGSETGTDAYLPNPATVISTLATTAPGEGGGASG
ncbi:MAG: hypothetical protein KBT06_05580 [Prevotellaceae bacterium]|nr:hypothetical protein [Candidatus Colivivens equi]